MGVGEFLNLLVRMNLAAGAAVLVVLALRKVARARFGARLAYCLWLAPVLAGLAVLIPARQVIVHLPAAPVLPSIAPTFFRGPPAVLATHTTAAPATGALRVSIRCC